MYILWLFLVSFTAFTADNNVQDEHVNLFDACLNKSVIFSSLTVTQIAPEEYEGRLKSATKIMKQALNEFHARHEDEVLTKDNVRLFKTFCTYSLIDKKPLTYLEFLKSYANFMTKVEREVKNERKCMVYNSSHFESKIADPLQVVNNLLKMYYDQKNQNTLENTLFTKSSIKQLKKTMTFGIMLISYYGLSQEESVIEQTQKILNYRNTLQGLSTVAPRDAQCTIM